MGIQTTIKKLLDQLYTVLRKRVVALAETINEVRKNASGANRLHVGLDNFANLGSDGFGGLAQRVRAHEIVVKKNSLEYNSHAHV